MSLELEISPPTPGEELELMRVIEIALASEPGHFRDWMQVILPENFRAVRQKRRIVAGLGLVRAGQWFGGVSVPMVGITAVGVAPDVRGSGIGTAMLRHVLHELHAEGVALSALYPATTTFYRQVGYERAGQRIGYDLRLDAIDLRQQAVDGIDLVTVDTVEPQQFAAFQQVYTEQAHRGAGLLDRPQWMWRRRIEPQQSKGYLLRYLVMRNAQAEGYLVIRQHGSNHPLEVLDMCLLTPPAARRVLALLARYRSVTERFTWYGGPHDPLAYLFGEPMIAARPYLHIHSALIWLLRMVHVPAALRTRGYPPAVQAELHLDVQDELLPANSGPLVLRVHDGHAAVEPGGKGRIRLGVRELAAIYSGFLSPFELRAIGNISGPDTDLALLGAVFAGARPYIVDMF